MFEKWDIYKLRSAKTSYTFLGIVSKVLQLSSNT